MSRSPTPDLRRVTSTQDFFRKKPMKPIIPSKGRTLLALSLLLLATPAAFCGDAAPARPSNGAKSNAPPQAPTLKFESWPAPPPRAATALAAPTAPDASAAEKAALAKAAGDKRLFEFHAENLELKAALALFARGNDLNIVPDDDVTGQVTLDVRNLPLGRLMQALLEAHDVTWTEEDGLIRVRSTETRMFSIDYLRLTRRGIGNSSATLSSSSGAGGAGGGAGGVGGGAGGGGLGGGAGGGTGGGAVGGGSGVSGSGGVGGSSINLVQENPINFWKELKEELQMLLTAKGKESLAVNLTAGLIQITDRPSALKKVARYLENLGSTVQRQVDIEAKLYDVTLSDQFQFGIDWQHVAESYGGQFAVAGAPTIVSPVGGFALKQAAFTMIFSNQNTKAMLTALQEQGKVSVISQPRLRTLNNQTALIKVGTDTPFFFQTTTLVPTALSTTTTLQQAGYLTITVGTILSITPQISTNGYVTLDISPVITSLLDTKSSADGSTTAPVLDIKQASTLVRVNNGDTIVIGGLIQTSSAKTTRKIPLLGDIPLLGKLFQGKFDAKQKKELVIFLTPTIVP